MLLATLLALVLPACGPSYRTLRIEGGRFVQRGNYAAARELFMQAEDKDPNRLDNLYDLGTCSVMIARERFQQRNKAAALRELDRAVAYYRRAIQVHPGHQPSLEGENVALELKGNFDEALDNVEWATKNIGPSAKQQIFLARELEERGDFDGARLRYKQAIAMESENPKPYIAFSEFLFRQGRDDDAVRHLKLAYDLDPRNREVAEELIVRGALHE